MTSAELQERMSALDARLQDSRTAGQWSAVAEIQAERQAVQEQLDSARAAERQAVQDAERNQAARTVQDLEAQGAALGGRWLAWLQDLDATERTARRLWAEYDGLRSSEVQLRAAYGKAAPGKSLDVGSYDTLSTVTAKAIKRGSGALVWRPRLGALDE